MEDDGLISVAALAVSEGINSTFQVNFKHLTLCLGRGVLDNRCPSDRGGWGYFLMPFSRQIHLVES